MGHDNQCQSLAWDAQAFERRQNDRVRGFVHPGIDQHAAIACQQVLVQRAAAEDRLQPIHAWGDFRNHICSPFSAGSFMLYAAARNYQQAQEL
jgi:hypothetical protein